VKVADMLADGLEWEFGPFQSCERLVYIEEHDQWSCCA